MIVARSASMTKTGVFGVLAVSLAAAPGWAQPSNDDCSNAIALAIDSPVSGSITGATTDGQGSCGAVGFADVWYRFVAPATGAYSFATCGGLPALNFAR